MRTCKVCGTVYRGVKCPACGNRIKQKTNMKTIILTILALALLSSLCDAQSKQKQLPITLTYQQALFIMNTQHKIDSLLSVSKLPTNEVLPLLSANNSINQLFFDLYRKAFVADSLKGVKK